MTRHICSMAHWQLYNNDNTTQRTDSWHRLQYKIRHANTAIDLRCEAVFRHSAAMYFFKAIIIFTLHKTHIQKVYMTDTFILVIVTTSFFHSLTNIISNCTLSSLRMAN